MPRANASNAPAGLPRLPPNWDRAAHLKELRKRYPPVSAIQLVRSPILEFVEAADLFLHKAHDHSMARAEADTVQKIQTFDEVNAILARVGGLALPARQTGYHLTNFDPVEIEHRCHTLQQTCLKAWQAVTSSGQQNEPYLRLSPFYDPYYTARNAVLELALAVRPELWEGWKFRPPGDVQTAEAPKPPQLKPPPLTDTESEVFEVIKAAQPVMGAGIVKAMKTRGTPIEQSTLTRHIIPKLKLHGVRNRRGVGYFVDQAT